ncbi:hypothetical protein FSARC_5596 [Fusarium sarcochroum]|uniref:Uncharacterized protein n=1 Tax=Fusarium sarcochroum TaxID=1208366 RepID=A0A8H4TZ42_9HYPO|nr:hypothetical protein FSARC_5596 [Fusarium sarcochroum]
MQYKLETLIAVGLAAMQAIAYSHGEQTEFDGKVIKWQQLAEGVFTGIPAEQWDDKIHRPSFQELDIDEIMSLHGDNSTLQDRNLELEARDIPGVCKVAVDCAAKVGDALLYGAFFAYFQTVSNVSGGKIMEFLNQPFVANAAGVAIAGVISGQINEATKKECSTSGSQLDVVTGAVQAALQEHRDATSISVAVTGPAGSWHIDITAKPKGESPTPKCFEG